MHGKFHGSIFPPKNMLTTTNIINIKFPYGNIIRSTMKGGLYLPMLKNTARQAHIYPNIKHSLVTFRALCDASLTETFRKIISLSFTRTI